MFYWTSRLIAGLIFCAYIYVSILYRNKVGAALTGCSVGSTGDKWQKAIESLSSTVDLGMTLSISLVGLGSAILLGLSEKVEIRLNLATQLLLLGSVSCFAQSALYGVWWKL